MKSKSRAGVLGWVAATAVLVCAVGLAERSAGERVTKAGAQAGKNHSLLALSKRDHTLAIVDAQALKVTTRVPVGADPHEVIASSDGTRAYVSIYGGGRYHALNVIDLTAGKALPDIDTGALNGPHGLCFVGGKVWFTAEAAKAVARFNTATNSIDWIMGTGENRTHMLYVTADEKKVYTTNVNAGTVSVLEQTTPLDWNATVIPVGKGAEGFDVSPDGRELWTANAQDGSLSVIDLPSKKVVATLDAKFVGSNRLKFTPDGKFVFVTSLRDGHLLVYDATSHREYRRVKIGSGAAGTEMDATGARAFVSCTPDDYVAVIDLKTFEVTSHIAVGGQPDGLAWAVRQ